jgi:hypothetical protein
LVSFFSPVGRLHRAVVVVVVVVVIIAIIAITTITNGSREPWRTTVAFQIAVRGQIVPRVIVARA